MIDLRESSKSTLSESPKIMKALEKILVKRPADEKEMIDRALTSNRESQAA